MIILCIFILLVGSGITCIKLMYSTKKDEWVIGAIVSFFILAMMIPAFFITYHEAANHLSIINKQGPMIEHYQAYIDRLDVKIKAAGEKGQAMFTSNHDTPVKSMVEAQLKAEDNMLDAAKARDEARIKLEALRLGLYGFVVSLVEGGDKK